MPGVPKVPQKMSRFEKKKGDLRIFSVIQLFHVFRSIRFAKKKIGLSASPVTVFEMDNCGYN